MYSQQSPEGMYNPPLDPYASQYPYPPQQLSGGVPFPPQYLYTAPQANVVLSNPRAKSAMGYGIISLVFSLLTLYTLVGFAGVFTGTFALVYGIMGLSMAGQLPNNTGRGQAITGLVLGSVAWFLVILSFIMRSAVQG